MEALGKLHGPRAWTAAIGALALLLLPSAVAAVPLSSTQHFLLGSSPYLHDGSDGEVASGYDGDSTPLNPGVNAPNVPVVDLSTEVPIDPDGDVNCTYAQDPEGCMPQWMRLLSSDWTGEVSATPPLPTAGTPTPSNPAELAIEFTITLDEFFEVAENAMVTEDGKLKLFFAIWDIRPTDPSDGFVAATQAPSVIGGFDKDSFSGDILTGPMIADATNAESPIPFPHRFEGDPNNLDTPGSPGVHIVQGMGIKTALNPGESATIFADYLAGQDLSDGTFFWDLYWYKNDVPEPGTAVMLLVGLAGVAYMRRRTH